MTDADLNTIDNSGRTPLSLAVEEGDEVAVKLFLEEGDSDLNAKDNDGRTLLLLVVANFHKTVVELLLEKDGVDSNILEKKGGTPLSWGAGSGYQEAMELLLKEEGVDHDSKDSNGRTPLSWAAGNGRWYGAKLLLEKDANPDIADNNGWTPLSWVVKNQNELVIELLLKRGANLNAADNDGRTPLSWLVDRGYHKFLFEKNYIKPAFSLTDTHWTPEFATLLSSETWELILKHVPEELRWDIDYTELYQSPPCWTLTPSPSLSLDSIPLTIAGAPVIIPVSFRYDLRPALSSPLDPHLELISPSISLKKKVVDAIFNTYDNPIDFYVLANGWLQIIVDEGFDSTDTLSHKPQTFGGPRVSYIQQTTRPCVSRTSISFNAEANQSSTSTTTMLCIGGLIKARISGSKSSAVDFEGRIGVMTKFEGRLYVTVSTHMGTEAWLSTKKVANLDVSWKDNVKLYSAGGTIKDARIALTFDPETGVFPIGFLHDTSLVEVTTLHDLQDTLRCPYPTDWLSDAEWSEPKPGNSSKLHLLGSSEEIVKNIPFEESKNIIIGRAVINTRKKTTWIEKVLSPFKGLEVSTTKPGPEDWTDYAEQQFVFSRSEAMEASLQR